MSIRYFERSWNIFEEIEEMERQNRFLRQSLLSLMRHRNYSFEKLKESTESLKYSGELEKFVEEKLGVTRKGECEEKINAMSTEQFIEFYKEVMDDWEAGKRGYGEPMAY